MRKNFNEFKSMIKGKKTAVVGIGVSNTPLIYFLKDLGAEVTAFDKKSEQDIGSEIGNMKKKGIRLVLGENYLDSLENFDVIFKTPSMRIDSPYLVKAKEQGAYITSEMEEFVKYCPAKTFGITGSDGKTTTTTIIYNILKEQGYKTWVGGNIGAPLFTRIEEISPKDMVVLELSSFQLMTMDVSTDVSLITNLSPNHLDIHKDMQEYINAKKNIFLHQDSNGIVVLNMDNKITEGIKDEVKNRVIGFSTQNVISDGAYFKDNVLYVKDQKVCEKDEIIIKGMHNVENFLAAFCCTAGDADVESMRKVAITFSGVEHRCEFVREVNGVKYYNDSIASSPTRTLAGLKAFGRPVILIAGGYDKNLPFDVLAEEGYKYVKILVVMGNTKDKIKKAFEKVIQNKNIHLPILTAENMNDAVEVAKDAARAGDIVTLSPACASFDQFKNFEVRGNTFKDIVNGIK